MAFYTFMLKFFSKLIIVYLNIIFVSLYAFVKKKILDIVLFLTYFMSASNYHSTEIFKSNQKH